MPGNLLLDDDRDVRVQHVPDDSPPDRGGLPDKSSVAELSAAEIDDMTRDELIGVIRGARLASVLHLEFEGRISYSHRTMLLRLAHLARRCCQNQGY